MSVAFYVLKCGEHYVHKINMTKPGEMTLTKNVLEAKKYIRRFAADKAVKELTGCTVEPVEPKITSGGYTVKEDSFI